MGQPIPHYGRADRKPHSTATTDSTLHRVARVPARHTSTATTHGATATRSSALPISQLTNDTAGYTLTRTPRESAIIPTRRTTLSSSARFSLTDLVSRGPSHRARPSAASTSAAAAGATSQQSTEVRPTVASVSSATSPAPTTTNSANRRSPAQIAAIRHTITTSNRIQPSAGPSISNSAVPANTTNTSSSTRQANSTTPTSNATASPRRRRPNHSSSSSATLNELINGVERPVGGYTSSRMSADYLDGVFAEALRDAGGPTNSAPPLEGATNSAPPSSSSSTGQPPSASGNVHSSDQSAPFTFTAAQLGLRAVGLMPPTTSLTPYTHALLSQQSRSAPTTNNNDNSNEDFESERTSRRDNQHLLRSLLSDGVVSGDFTFSPPPPSTRENLRSLRAVSLVEDSDSDSDGDVSEGWDTRTVHIPLRRPLINSADPMDTDSDSDSEESHSSDYLSEHEDEAECDRDDERAADGDGEDVFGRLADRYAAFAESLRVMS
ncbi:hypothetical protein HK097_003225, partial [Rhizophlyctis rosea]